MCGICGYLSKAPVDYKVLDRMTDLLTHRGPDDRGTFTTERVGYNIGLGHRRLSIIDLSTAAHQPMSDDSGRYTIVFNGEIYNYRELTDRLAGCVLHSTSDTEVLLQMYIRYGFDCLQYLNGMFAFAVYDKDQNTLFLARDRMGEKPLYYHLDGGNFLFASELKSILAYPGLTLTIDRELLLQYFGSNYIHPPYTIFRNTYKLCAGEYLLWSEEGVRTKRYYSPVDSYFSGLEDCELSYALCKKTLKELLYDSVEKRLISDVPIGSFLSGGIDSTLISAIAADLRSEHGLDTFSIGFEDEQYDESAYARQSAAHLGTHHHEEIMRETDLLRMLEDLAYYYDEPFADSSQLPTMLVAEFARKSVTTVLSGDGGDELFAGYTSNDTIRALQRLDPILMPLRAILPCSVSGGFAKDRDRILFEKKKGPEKIQYYAKTKENLARSILLQTDGINTVHYRRAVIDDARINTIDNPMQQRMLIDTISYLPDEIMTKTDRASMRFSLEMRSPLLDHRIVDYSMRIPFEYKYSVRKSGLGADKKHILKDILYDFIPQELIDRSKRGFAAPVYKWLQTILADRLSEITDSRFVEKQGLFDSTGVTQLMKRFCRRDENSVTQVMWSYYVFQNWYGHIGHRVVGGIT